MKVHFKSIKYYLSYLLIIVVIVIFFFDRILAIWLGFIFIVIIFALHFPSLTFKSRLVNYMKKNRVADDKIIAEKFKCTIEEVQEEMANLSKKNNREDWLISNLNNRYVFYNKDVIETIIDLYNLGMNEKYIFERLKKDTEVKTRAEIRAIEDILIRQKRIQKRTDRFNRKNSKE